MSNFDEKAKLSRCALSRITQLAQSNMDQSAQQIGPN